MFVRSGNEWEQQAKLAASDALAGDLFGNSVAIHKKTVVIGAQANDGEGSAYVFVRSGNEWEEQAKLKALDATGGDVFGHSVAIHGKTAMIGAFFDEDNGFQSGSAYVFDLS